MKKMFSDFIMCLVYVGITPLMTGIMEQGQDYLAYYTGRYLNLVILIELAILSLACLKLGQLPIYIGIIFSLCFCIMVDIFELTLLEKYFGFSFQIYHWICRVCLQHCMVRTLLSMWCYLLTYVIESSVCFWWSANTTFQWICYFCCRGLHLLYTTLWILSILSLRAVVIPKIFLPDSPLTLQSHNAMKGNKSNTIDMIMENQMMLSRFVSEDIALPCLFVSDVLDTALPEVIWTLNGTVVRQSNRHTFHYRRSKNIHSYNLVISNILPLDFGEYRCIQRFFNPREEYDRNGNEICVKRDIDHEVVLKRVTMIEHQKQLLNVTVPLATVINMVNCFEFNIFRKNAVISWLHTVNRFSYDTTCSNFEHVSGHIPTNHQLKYKTPDCSLERNLFRCNISLSICSKALGIHEFGIIISDKYGNNETLHHPFKLIVLPKGTILSHGQHYGFYDRLMTDMLMKKWNVTSDILKLIQAKEMLELRKCELLTMFCRMAFTFIIICISLIMDVFFDTSCLYIVYMYEEHIYFLGSPIKKKIFQRQMKYDIFVSFCEADKKFVYKTVIPLLENKLGLTVCVPDRDMAPQHSLWMEHVENISASRKIIVILSDAYLRDSLCNRMQFTMLIMPMLYNGDKLFRDVFLLKYKACNVPSFYDSFLTVTYWYEYKNKDILTQELINWMKESEPSALEALNNILLRVAMTL